MSPKSKIDRKSNKTGNKDMISEKTGNKDMISSLPDEVLAQILSLLPTKYAVATSILSSQWKTLYKLSNTLDFDASSFKNHSSFIKFVSRVIVNCQESEIITKFRLKCETSIEPIVLTYWINCALNLFAVPELEVLIEMRNSYQLNLPQWACENFRVLKLGYNFILRVPENVKFSCLKILFFEGVTFPECEKLIHSDGGVYWVNGVNTILSNCPLLEELSIIGCDWKGCDLVFANPLLKKLTFEVGIRGNIEQLNGSSVIFNLPSLVYLKYSDSLPAQFCIRCLVSVVDAHFEVGFNDDEFEDQQELCNTMLALIKGVSNCKFLDLSSQCLEALISGEYELPDFQNLTRLKLEQGWDVSWNHLLRDFLNNSPCLEDLTLVQEYRKWDSENQMNADFLLGDHPIQIPRCVSSCLKVIKLENFRGLQGDMKMVYYFLKTANVLEEIVIHWEKVQLRAEKEKLLLRIGKASKICSITFK